ncbi:MAG: TM2 domain-containing protein [Balneolaceae bacterium]|jgi:TM2 domain-containing membrane protein YozV|nr:TM2 domain-containing protein [Balneolaceae bacterium]
MKKIFELLPELEGDESQYISRIIEEMPDEKAKIFSNIYRSRRRDPILLLILALIGLFGVAGIHRFFVGHIGMGILYLVTAGLCFIGTIVDMINYKNFAFEYNRKVAQEILKDFDT